MLLSKEQDLVRENDAAANLFERLLTVVDGIDCLACRCQDGEHERWCVVPWVRVWLATHAQREDA